jgi:hypothetical protein
MTTTDTLAKDAGPDRIKAAASDVAGEATRTAEQTASRGMDRAADALEQFSTSIRDAESELRDQQPQLAGAMDTALQQLDHAAAYLREHEPRQVLEDAEATARRQPAAVVVGGLVLGLALGRVLRSAASGTPTHSHDSFGQSNGGSRQWSQASTGGSQSGGYRSSGSHSGVGVSAGSTTSGSASSNIRTGATTPTDGDSDTLLDSGTRAETGV